jgi:hypothetical protein
MKNLLCYFSFIGFILLQSCQKEVSLQTITDSGRFEFISSPGVCAIPVISGTWEVGKNLDATNTITLPVQVNEKGTWSYKEEANGIALSGSGNFTDTGAAIIVLKATGVPLIEGLFNFVLSATAGCSFDITVVTGQGTNPGGTLDGPYYYKATIGGEYFEAKTKTVPTSDDDYLPGYGMGGQENVEFSAILSPFSNPKPGLTIIEISKGILFDYFSATNDNVKDFFAPGSYPYISADSLNFPNAGGISIIWGDKENKLWSTEYGTGDQTGSSFKIITMEEDNDPTVLLSLKVKMQFNCKLYKEDTGEMKQLTNGEMVGSFARL